MPSKTSATNASIDFLRLSRSSVDDTITQRLNALVMPSKAGFDPSSTSQIVSRPLARQINPNSCRDFKNTVLFPAWDDRSRVLRYCASVAASLDPDDPEAATREAEKELSRERVVDERRDPYSARSFPKESRTEQLSSLIRQEEAVEGIVRSRTWDIVRQRCGGSLETWEQAIRTWRRSAGTL
jgi:hypothetical protein